MRSIRMLLGPVVMMVELALAFSTAAHADITRHCNGRYLVREVSAGQFGFSKQIPNPDFTTTGTCGAIVPNRCRERARDRANRCMQAHWDQRMNRNTVPDLCILRGMRGYTVRDLKDDIERVACCADSPLRNRSATLLVQRMSWGDMGCGSGKRDKFKVQRHVVTLSDYDVDCPSVRARLCP